MATENKEEQEFDKRMDDMGLNAPRIRSLNIDEMIKSAKYFVDETFTICVLTLTNGHKVVGTSRPVSDANFRQQVGEEAAFKQAREKIWELAGYDLRNRLLAEQFEARLPG
jgi:hypothetical protein